MIKKLSLLFLIILSLFISACSSEQQIISNQLEENINGTIVTNSYVDFSKEIFEKELENREYIILQFYATWCYSCVSEDKLIKNNFNNLPENILIFRINFNDENTDDYEKELAKKYGVTERYDKIILKNGEFEKKIVGHQNKEWWIKFLETFK